MTKGEAGRRYLQASMAAGYTGLPDEHREAHEDTMRQLERRNPGVRDRALAGADQDFDKPLSAGEREHQSHLRGEEGLQHSDVLRMRRELRGGGGAPAPRGRGASAGSRRAAVRAGAAGGRAYARARRQIASSSGAQDAGSLTLQAIGVAIGLSLLYLALSPKGSKAFSSLLNGLTGFLRLIVSPIDPLNPSGASPLTPVQTSNYVAESPSGSPLREYLKPPTPAQLKKEGLGGAHVVHGYAGTVGG